MRALIALAGLGLVLTVLAIKAGIVIGVLVLIWKAIAFLGAGA